MTDTPTTTEPLRAELLLLEPATFDAATLASALDRLDARSVIAECDGRTAMIEHGGYAYELEDGHAAIATALVVPDAPTKPVDCSQSWSYPDAEATASAATERRGVVEMSGSSRPTTDRIAAFSNGLRALIEALNPAAVWFSQSQQVLSADQVRSENLAPFVNVRFFPVDGDDSMFMDTLGLATFGLPDLQCHFSGIDPTTVAHMLYNVAAHLITEGPMISDGDSIPGPDGENWWCHASEALVGPRRPIRLIEPQTADEVLAPDSI